MATIKQYKDKVSGQTKYRVRTLIGRDKQGKQIVKTKQGFLDKTSAKKWLNEIEKDMLMNGRDMIQKQIASSNLKYKQVYLEWLETYRNTVKESTFVTTQRIFKLHILPLFGVMRLSKIDKDYCQNAVNYWFKTPLKQYKRIAYYTNKVFKYAIQEGYLGSSPMDRITMPQIRPVRTDQDVNYYDKETLQKFLGYLIADNDLRGYVFFRLLAFSGLRKGEALALTWSDIDFDKNMISVNKTQTNGSKGIMIQSPKTISSYRSVWLDQKTMQVLANHKVRQHKWLRANGYSNIGDKKQLVFPNGHNNMLQPVKPRVWLTNCIEKHDLPHITVHGFRHTYASLAVEAGLNVKQLQSQLGHRSVRTTLDVYAAVTKTLKNGIADQYADYLGF